MQNEVNSFLEYLRESGIYAQNTYSTYKKSLEKLIDYIGADTDVRTIRKKHLQDFINSLPESLKATTVNHHVYVTRLFFKFLLEFDFIEGDVSSVLKTKEQSHIEVETIDEEVFDKLIDFDLENILDYRDKAILLLMYYTGALPGEICSLTLNDYDSDNKTVTYRRTTGIRTLKINLEITKILDEYIRIKEDYRPAVAIFASKNDNELNHRTLFNIIRKRTKDANIKQRVSGMVFRFSYADRLFKEGTDIRKIQKLLGHSHTYLTQRFMYMLPDDN